MLFSEFPATSMRFWIYLFISVFCKFAVPVFLAISGALVLSKSHETLKQLWFKRITKIAFILVFTSLLYYLYYFAYRLSAFGQLSIADFLVKLYSCQISVYLWYLYLYISFLIISPLLRLLVKNMENYHFYYIFAIVIFFNFLHPIEYLTSSGKISMDDNLKILWLGKHGIIFPCLGYFFQHRLKYEALRKWIPWLWIASVSTIGLSCYLTFHHGQFPGKWIESFHNSFVVFNCAAIFVTTRYLFEKRDLHVCLRKIVLSIGSCTFGIYLLHMFVENFLISFSLPYILEMGMDRMICIMFSCLLILLVSYIITLITSRLPVIKKLVGF